MYVFVQCCVGFVMSMDNAHMNKVHLEKTFLFEVYPDFRLCEILLASFVTALSFPQCGRIAFGLATINFAKLVVLQFIR